MRPTRLEMKGFSAYRERTVVDLRDVELAAIVGPTGAGKSSIIDAIAFALYGSVVRYRAANLVAPVINQLANEARVRLDFEIEGAAYTAVRVVRRTAGGATTREARLECGNAVLAGTARELDAAVEELLGLDFDQFTKTVVLPQGEFARFLTEAASDRQRLLRRLLGMDVYRSIGAAARERAKLASATTAALEERVDEMGEVTAEDIATAEARLAALMSLRGELDTEVEQRHQAKRARDEAATRLAGLDDHLDRLAAVELPVEAGRFAERSASVDELERSAHAEAEAAALMLAEAEERRGRLPRTAELEQQVRSVEALSAHADRHAELEAELVEATATLEAAVSEADEAARHSAESEQARDNARMRMGAAGLAELLTTGEPCPVCLRIVDELPSHEPTVELDRLDEHHEQARRRSLAAVDARTEATRNQARLQAAFEASSKARVELLAAVPDGADAESLAAALAEAVAADEVLDEARARVARARDMVDDAVAARGELESLGSELRDRFTSARDSVAPLGPPKPGSDSILHDWERLVEWVGKTGEKVRTLQVEETTALQAADDEITKRAEAIFELCRPHVDDPEQIEDPIAWVAEEIGRAEVERDNLVKTLRQQDQLRTRISESNTESAVSSELGRLLSARGFEQWLMADAMNDLANRATGRLFDLSGYRYSLITDGTDFSIRDHRNADEIRGARTLSGGETFLASLALALALADSVAELATERAPTIESIFLDEGFGTLDDDTLDVVASAMEELGASGRLVVIVTHIRELADRMSVRFQVDRGPSTSTVARVDG